MIKGEQIISTETIPYYIDCRKKPLWRVNYTYTEGEQEYKNGVYIDNPTMRRLERFKIERHKHNYLAEIINKIEQQN